jgi:hypothetical protein
VLSDGKDMKLMSERCKVSNRLHYRGSMMRKQKMKEKMKEKLNEKMNEKMTQKQNS